MPYRETADQDPRGIPFSPPRERRLALEAIAIRTFGSGVVDVRHRGTR